MNTGLRLFGLFSIIPATMLLTVSFFVMFGLLKTENQKLKTFGRAVTMLLWICAAVILISGLYLTVTGHHPFIPTISRSQNPMMSPEMANMRRIMMQQKMRQMQRQIPMADIETTQDLR